MCLFFSNFFFSFCMSLIPTYLLVMSSSWNFPAPAEPSYEGSKLSRAELGHFDFRAETELCFFWHSFFSSIFFSPLKLVILQGNSIIATE